MLLQMLQKVEKKHVLLSAPLAMHLSASHSLHLNLALARTITLQQYIVNINIVQCLYEQFKKNFMCVKKD